MGKKIRVNITVDGDLLKEAKKKLHLFGGKLSTLFNAYLKDFVDSIDKDVGNQKALEDKLRELEDRLKRLEKKN